MDFSEDDTTTKMSPDPKQCKKKIQPEKPKKHLLSFEEELNEDEDTFQVKKSNHSKRLSKILNKERLKKKQPESFKTDSVNKQFDAECSSGACNDIDITNGNVSDNDSRECNSIPHSNVPESELSVEDISSDDEVCSKCPETDRLKIFLQCGQIPDATAIHAAKKRRQMAREGERQPLCVSLKTVSVIDEVMNQSMASKRPNWEPPEVQTFGDPKQSYCEEETQWESQQLKKGVSKGHLEAICREFGLDKFSRNVNNLEYICQSKANTAPKYDSGMGHSIIDTIRSSLNEMKLVHKENCLKLDEINTALDEQAETRMQCEDERPKLEKRLRFYQELRYYVLNLVELLNEKVPLIEGLEKRFCHVLRKMSVMIIDRRRQDVRDETEEQLVLVKGSSRRDAREEESRVRRSAERDGRRARRRRTRTQQLITDHTEGMSSDDEMTEVEQASFVAKITAIATESKRVWDDVVEEFCFIPRVLSRFEDWLESYRDDFREAYGGLCLPKILGPMIRVEIMTWNPIIDTFALEDSDWFRCVSIFGNCSQTEANSEFSLAANVVDNVVLRKLHDVVDAAWDPMSTTQTLRVVGFINKLIGRHPTIADSKRMAALADMVVEKMRSAVANDVSIPMRALQSCFSLFERQVAAALKLLRNMFSWHGIVADRALHDVAIGVLLNRYLLTALKACCPRDAVRLCGMIATIFPRAWFHEVSQSPPLDAFITLLKALSSSLTGDNLALQVVEKLIADLNRRND